MQTENSQRHRRRNTANVLRTAPSLSREPSEAMAVKSVWAATVKAMGIRSSRKLRIATMGGFWRGQ